MIFPLQFYETHRYFAPGGTSTNQRKAIDQSMETNFELAYKYSGLPGE